jgi:hypothetical protein
MPGTFARDTAKGDNRNKARLAVINPPSIDRLAACAANSTHDSTHESFLDYGERPWMMQDGIGRNMLIIFIISDNAGRQETYGDKSSADTPSATLSTQHPS